MLALTMQRQISIDIARGVAILGILLMNISSFAYPEAAYFNPDAYQLSALDKPIFYGMYLLVNQKMMGLLSLLFGASVVLLSEAALARGDKPLGYYYRRTAWLFIIGMAHAILLWEGDVLTIYAVCGCCLFWLRNWSSVWLITLGIIVFLLPGLVQLDAQEQLLDLSAAELKELIDIWAPSAASIQAQIDSAAGPYYDRLLERIDTQLVEPDSAAKLLFWDSLYIEFFGRALGMMLLGMGLYRSGVLQASKSKRFYQIMAVAGLSIGLAITATSLWLNIEQDWHADYSMFAGRVLNYFGTLALVFGFVGVIVLFSNSAYLPRLKQGLIAVGRTALTNYLMHSVIALFVFGGLGFGLFGQLDRLIQLLLVALIWACQMVLSVWWLKRFRYGPVEYCWRCASQWSLVPMRRTAQ